MIKMGATSTLFLIIRQQTPESRRSSHLSVLLLRNTSQSNTLTTNTHHIIQHEDCHHGPRRPCRLRHRSERTFFGFQRVEHHGHLCNSLLPPAMRCAMITNARRQASCTASGAAAITTSCATNDASCASATSAASISAATSCLNNAFNSLNGSVFTV